MANPFDINQLQENLKSKGLESGISDTINSGAGSGVSDYGIRAVTSGKDALGEASIKVTVKKRLISGRGMSTDVIEASVKAYLNAMNKISWHAPSKIKQCT